MNYYLIKYNFKKNLKMEIMSKDNYNYFQDYLFKK